MSLIKDWKYYNHAIIPTTAPHKVPDIESIKDGSIWKEVWRGTPYFARWTTDFDCGYETQWWYCIKDTVFDISKLPSKRRYEINKGKKHFVIERIDPTLYVEEIIRIQELAWAKYPKAYRPQINKEKTRADVVKWKQLFVFGAFGVDDKMLHAYALLDVHQDWADFTVLKAEPESEKLSINAAMVAGICEYFNDRLGSGFYISDGERNTVHETAFQDFLIKYFEFRKAYCKLNLAYRKPIGFLVKVLYPFRGIISKMKSNSLLNKVNAILTMVSYSRAEK